MTIPDEVSRTVLIPNERGLENALEQRDRFDEVNCFLSASESHNRANVNRSVEESLSGLERVIARARAEGLRAEGVISVSFGCPYEGHVDPERGLRDRQPPGRRRARRRSASATRPAWPTRCRCGSSSRGRFAEVDGRRADRPLPQHPRPGPGQRARRARGGLRLVRVVASASSAAARSRPARRATSPPRTSSRCSTRWGSRPGSTSDALLDAARAARDVLGRPLGSHTLIAGGDRLASAVTLLDLEPVLSPTAARSPSASRAPPRELGLRSVAVYTRRRRARRPRSTPSTSRRGSTPTSTPRRCSTARRRARRALGASRLRVPLRERRLRAARWPTPG